ncbi:iron-containing redox enzyme family protein [Streptomyces sp. Ru73]|uniref:iron-containing redox enzyme family protein n=1 Tax=Streptomyces sp. Ru73 TaxID=2080748 RepID=UPI000CDE32F4|nr:iron-containing redox enzyme family protein [Streptomyces sp. Ru73]POX43230.1 iron-containing redox enzyme family protein [Streptomyces sp. Ru73]
MSTTTTRTAGSRLFVLNRTIPTPDELRELHDLEQRLIVARADAIEAAAPDMPDRAALNRHMKALLTAEEADPPPFERVLAEDLTRDQFKEVVAQFAVDGLTESESFLPIVWRLPKKAKMAVFRVLVDEFGCGNLDQAHFHIYRELMLELGMSVDVNDYLDTTNEETFDFVNAFFWAAARAPYPEYFLGTLCYLECSILYAFKPFAAAAERLGLNPRYYTEHLHIDHFHAKELQVAIRELDAEAELHPAKVWTGFKLASEVIGGATEAAVASALKVA